MAEDAPQRKKRVTIILHSGAYDRASYALSIAQAALASDMEVHMMLTYEGLKRFTKKHLTDIGEETPATVRANIKQGLEAGAIQHLEEQLAEAKNTGLKIHACPNVMAGFHIPRRDLVGVDDVMGLATFLSLALTADINWYI
ncbi:DsrE/DsrF/DrsH-like family protein [Chloroflexota bacterium]